MPNVPYAGSLLIYAEPYANAIRMASINSRLSAIHVRLKESNYIISKVDTLVCITSLIYQFFIKCGSIWPVELP